LLEFPKYGLDSSLISVMVSRSVWDREGGGSSPPWVTNFEFTHRTVRSFRSDSSMDRAVGYGPTNEGSSPSPNTIFEPKEESYYGSKPLFRHLLVFRVRSAANFIRK
jgi:hypothetical protein